MAGGVFRRRGLLGGTRAMFRRMGEFSRPTRGCGAKLGVFGSTKDVAADGRGEIFLYKGQVLF